MHTIQRVARTASAALCMLAFAGTASAQDYPNRPLRMVVGYSPGGATDTLARLTAQQLGARLGQNVVVDNRPGATGIIGAETVMRSEPDGYTLLFISSAEFTALPAMRKSLSFDPLRDFTALALVVSGQTVFVVHPDVPAKSMQELVKFARIKPGSLRWGSSGIGGALHLLGEHFWRSVDAVTVHVPYKGGGDMVAAVLGRQIEMIPIGVGTVSKQVLAGQLRALAVTGETRSPVLPQVPTLAESGFPERRPGSWWGVVGPAALPESIAARLANELRAAAQSPGFRTRIAEMGITAEPVVREAFRELIARDLALVRQIVAVTGIRLDQ